MEKPGIKAIVLNLSQRDENSFWIIGHNCDEIIMGRSLSHIWYQPISEGVSRGCYWAENVDKVFYTDGSIIKSTKE